MKKFLTILLVMVIILVTVAFLIIQKIDRTPYAETKHFHAFEDAFEQVDWTSKKGIDTLGAGWALVNLTPSEPVPMGGYGARWGKKYTSVHDSVYVRAIALQVSPERVIFLVSADILIIPPNVTSRLKVLLENQGLSLDDVFLGASHSHSSIGGWGQKLLGRLFAGKYDENVERLIADRLYQAILLSRDQLKPATIAYWEADFENGVNNRLHVEEARDVDGKVRGLKIERADNTTAILVTYQAHSTLIPKENLELSRDYAGFLVDSLEAKGIADFAVFFSGSVGSMSSNVKGEGIYGPSQNLADSLVGYTQRFSHLGIPLPIGGQDTVITFFSKGFYAPLPAPTARITKNLALKSWVFQSLFGISPAYIKVTRIGNILLLGMPADFSGEITKELDAYARAKGLHLIVTSFNGEYIGYVTNDRWYDHNLYETTTMSWFGYQNADYLTEVAKRIIEKMSK